MNKNIVAILFDMGGTLRKNIKRVEPEKVEFIQPILHLIGSQASGQRFAHLLTSRAEAYETWAAHHLTELNETDLWTQWMLPDWPAEFIRRNAMELNRLWREAICTRQMFPETHPTILELSRRGYRLGLVSNTTSSLDAPLALEQAGIAGCFEVVVLSCLLGVRKPAPEILLEAARRLGLLPGQCAYIGDRPDWDVAAARSAGFGMTVILNPEGNTIPAELTPDHTIESLTGLLGIFPPMNGRPS